MKLILILTFDLALRFSNAEEPPELLSEPINAVDAVEDYLAHTEVVLAFAMCRHGDRTPDQEELDLYDTNEDYSSKLFPFGMKALTNKGKQRGFLVGDWLRMRYDGLISRLYLPDEVTVRTTDYARTKMTALTALASLYPPPPAQRWNPALNWQPVPYNTMPYADDDLLYWYNCPRYLALRDRAYDYPEVKEWVKPYESLFKLLTEKTGRNITKPEDVFYLDNLFQALENVGVEPPEFTLEVMPQIKEVTKIEFAVEFYTSELIGLATGPLMADILNTTRAVVTGSTDQPKLYFISAHENNVAAIMAAVGVFQPHQPKYGATFVLELRKDRLTGQYGFVAVYSPEAGGPGVVLPIKGCNQSTLMCDYKTFVNLTQDVVWSRDRFVKECPKLT